MSVRTCQFCGKPLSRWSGAGDYCSKEHRNQHRLRMGMDRLAEANKVASLMRRRENLKPITGLQPVTGATMENRPMSTLKISATQGPAASFKPSSAALSMPRLISPDNPASQTTCLAPFPNSMTGDADPKVLTGVRLRSRKAPMIAGPQKIRSAAQLARAPVATPRCTATPAEADYRTAKVLRTAARQPYLAHMRRKLSTRIPKPFHKPCGPQSMLTAAVAGMDLRVSKSQGFRLPKMRTRSTLIGFCGQGKLTWKSTPFQMEVLHAAPELEPSIAPLRAIVREPRVPGARALIGRSGSNWPVVRPMKLAAPFDPVSSLARVERTNWNTEPAESTLHCDWYQTEPKITFGYAEERKRAAAESAKAPTVAMTRVQENFDSGCANWVGGVSDWKLDAAGARTGSLAFYSPSMELTDYDVEFLVRVENHTATWVFRATDEKDHYRATLQATPEGGYEFTRAAVIGGKEEPAVCAPVTANSKTRTALAVRTSVKGNSFSVFVDGQAVDHWSDARLPAGGVGFGSAPDERARLYWVRVSYSEGPSLKDVTR